MKVSCFAAKFQRQCRNVYENLMSDFEVEQTVKRNFSMLKKMAFFDPR